MDKLAIIGGSYLQRPLVDKCKELGIETHVFSWEKGAVCKDIADYFYPISIIEKERILEVCKNIGINAITTIASDVAVVTVNYVADQMGLISNPARHTSITTNKYLMREALSQQRIPCPAFVKATKEEDVDKRNFKLPLIVKPTDRSGSRGVFKIESFSELRHAISRAIEESFDKEAIVEEFVDGSEISVESISYQGKHYILQITDKVTTGAPYYVELEHHQPSSLPEDIQNNVKDIVIKALNALHIQNGASHSELKITPEGDIKIIEIGARMGGDFIGSHLVQLSTGYDFLKGVIDVAFGRFEEPMLTNAAHCGVFFLSKETAYLKNFIENKDKYPQIIKAEITDNQLHEIHESADRSGYLIYKSDSRFTCK